MECPSCGHEFLPGEDSCEKCSVDLTTVALPQPKLGRLRDIILEDPLSQLNAPPPILLRPGDTVARAVELMKKHRYGSVFVVADDGRLAGIFTERDLVRRLSGRQLPVEALDRSVPPRLEEVSLAEVMTPDPHALGPDDTIASALHCMAVGGYRHIPLIREGTPVGFVSIRGILSYIAQNAL